MTIRQQPSQRKPPLISVRIPCVIIAFSEPPEKFRFFQSKSRKTWWRKLDDVEIAKQIGTALAALGIHGRIKRPRAKAIIQAHQTIVRKTQRARANSLNVKTELKRQEVKRKAIEIIKEQERRAADIVRRYGTTQ